MNGTVKNHSNVLFNTRLSSVKNKKNTTGDTEKKK